MERSIKYHRNAGRIGSSMKLHCAISGAMTVRISGLSPINHRGEYFEIVCAPIEEKESKFNSEGGKRVQSNRYI